MKKFDLEKRLSLIEEMFKFYSEHSDIELFNYIKYPYKAFLNLIRDKKVETEDDFKDLIDDVVIGFIETDEFDSHFNFIASGLWGLIGILKDPEWRAKSFYELKDKWIDIEKQKEEEKKQAIESIRAEIKIYFNK